MFTLCMPLCLCVVCEQKLCDQDYYLLPEGAYHLLKQWYGGPGPDFMRRVVEIGNQKEAKVEVFPYFLYYSWADSQVLRGTERMQTGASPLMAESTVEAEEAVKRVCVAAGLDLDLMSLYMVVEEEGDTGDGKGGKLEPIDLQSYKTRSLGDIFFGQHRVQVRGGKGGEGRKRGAEALVGPNTSHGVERH